MKQPLAENIRLRGRHIGLTDISALECWFRIWSDSSASCSPANCVLVKLGSFLEREEGPSRRKPLFVTAKANIDRYLSGQLWNPEIGAFRFSEFGAYSPAPKLRWRGGDK